ncbi:MAG: HAMP domain-containing sensor histidine kinase [Gemmatimonadaceae bacterium]
MNATSPIWRPNRRRLWSNWLWLLALVMGIAALWSGVRVVHDGRLRRETLRMLAHDRAVEIGVIGQQRFDLLLREAFSPLWTARGPVAQRARALQQFQSVRSACRCVETLPIVDFFEESNERRPAIRGGTSLTIDSVGLATAWVPDPLAPDGRMFGTTMRASDLVRVLFEVIPRGRSADTAVGRIVVTRLHFDMGGAAHSGRELLRLDSLSVRVSHGGQALFGRIGEGRYLATTRGPGSLAPLEITVGIRPGQASMGVLMPVAHDRLWLNGVITLCTLLVVVFAVGSSRREVLLARARSDFIAGVSHDLRMPLAQILLASETLTLKRDRDAQDRDTLSASILREARRLNHMVDNVLLFSRTGAVGLRPQLSAIEVGDLFTEVIEAVHLAAADAGQSVEADVDVSLRVMGDRHLLRQAFVNLVDNALKYGARGQRVRLAGRADGTTARLTVEDEGPGIPAAERARLFEAYERLGRDQTSERTGSGLGLAVVKQIVVSSGGHVFVDDAPTGARVVITLPRATG